MQLLFSYYPPPLILLKLFYYNSLTNSNLKIIKIKKDLQPAKMQVKSLPITTGDPPATRTRDTLIKSQVLYRLS